MDTGNKPKIIAVIGPTTTGKSDVAVVLAQKYAGEIVSADSRQVYRGLDIATGKITPEEMCGVPHHLLDIADPNECYTVADFQRDGRKAMQYILQNDHVPIITGGTGFYIEALVDGVSIPEVPPNTELRKKLGELETDKLFSLLQKKDLFRAETIDPFNKVRLIRALEIVAALGTVPKKKRGSSPYDVLFIGLDMEDGELKERIKARASARMKQGMLEEARQLHTNGLSYDRMRELGLEYRILAYYLEHGGSKEALVQEIALADWHYAKRQRTWFRRDTRIQWFHPKETNRILSITKTFLQ